MTYSEQTLERLKIAKEVPLVGLIRELGYKLDDTGSYLTMLSPFRSESVGSLFIDKRRPTKWKDYGNGKRGDSLDFVQELFGYTKKQAIDYLLGKRNIPLPDYPPVKREKNSIDVTSIQPYREGICPELDSYIASRYICPHIASIYLYVAEIKFPYSPHTPEKIHTVLAFPNDSKGYEFRSKKFKIGNSPKNITTIRGDNTKCICLFEGFPDFLSWLTYHNEEAPSPIEGTCIVLNSVSFIGSILPILKGCTVAYYGQNDRAGDEAYKRIEDAGIEKLYDFRGIYKNYKDLNDWHVATHKKKGYLSDILKIQ